MKNFDFERIYQERQSGKDFARPVYKEMRFGDVLVVHDLSQFGRNKEEIRNEWKN
ncbi:hypothetical protein [Bacillus sp. OV166]|uniref:hypothetical protein n=1 Tax=Bacillus sp. OV166 TaxID=1882763 RepID=UPI00211AFE68|nr:hypothetical protein [Bacillus sp. OV166]